jgi:putative hydrolase of the HAD superfamily
LGLRAVVFDYGMVLTGQPDAAAYGQLLRITGLTKERLDGFYWADRDAYDQGKLTGFGFWEKIVGDAGLTLSKAELDELNLWDARMWTTENAAMLAWQLQVKERGFLTGILSNMGDNVLKNMERTFDWLPRFDVLVWSFQLKMAKPDAAIYRHLLKELGTRAEETLFIDDRAENIVAAEALGIKGLLFTTVERLRADLIAQGLDTVLPLPE